MPHTGKGEQFSAQPVTIAQAGRIRILDIVGHEEADPAAGRLSFASPLARALVGVEARDEVEFAGTPILIKAVEASIGPLTA